VALLIAGLLGVFSVAEILARTGGEPAAALDDSYIHFQFAKTFARWEPLVYSPGGAAVPGATSLLWPVLLAPFYALGLEGSLMLWPAWAFGFGALGLLAMEGARSTQRIAAPECSFIAAALVLSFGGFSWCAASGMEVIPFAWLFLRAVRRAAELGEPRDDRGVGNLELVLLAWATPLMRPEGALASLLLAVAMLAHRRGSKRAWSAAAALGAIAPLVVNRILTGSARSTTLQVKWLFSTPYSAGVQPWQRTLDNVEFLFVRLLDGEFHSALFVPTGAAVFAWLSLPALLVQGYRKRVKWRAFVLAVAALALLVPCTYDTFLWNRLRYVWPFIAVWFVAIAVLADALGELCARISPALASARVLLGGVFIGALSAQLGHSIDDVAQSASGIYRQQVALGKWAANALPKNSLIGVNDTGAITYYSGHRTFDVVGLTTPGEARYWVAGPGARFEHYERLGAARLPTHFIVYPEWLGIPPLLGAWLSERTVTDSTIVGGPTMAAHVADYSELGSAEQPRTSLGRILDRLDVADLDSENAHAFALHFATSQETVVLESDGEVDGGRVARTEDRFELRLGRGVVIARLAADRPTTVDVRCDERALARTELSGQVWDEIQIHVPPDVPPGRHTITVTAAPGRTFASLHYWSMHGGQ
jgi:hypothetical protein